MSKNSTTTAAFEELNTTLVRFLENPRKRKRIFGRIETLTETICDDEGWCMLSADCRLWEKAGGR